MRKSFIVFSGLLILGLLLTACQTLLNLLKKLLQKKLK